MIVTDYKYQLKNGELQQGYNMDGYLAENLAPVANYLKQDRDIVGIIAGRGDVRVGKSSIASMVAFYCAWVIAGGRMDLRRDEKGKFINPIILKYPDKEVRFSLDNVVFHPDDLMKLGRTLPKNSVIMYDEGRAGLDSKNTMTSLNKMLEDFFQEVGQMNHIILVVLPDFFSLGASIATNRSMFLIDVYCDDNLKRGYFNYFGAKQKEFLFWMGKKKIGQFARANAAPSDFHGKFPNFMPFDREEYNKKKLKALKEKGKSTREQKNRINFIALIQLFKQKTNLTTEQLAEGLGDMVDYKITPNTIQNALADYQRYLKKANMGGMSL